MRAVPLLAVLALLGACAGPLPQPDPQQAWIEFRTEPGELLMAEKLDGKRLDDGRYFQVSPGAHRLLATYRFEVQVGPIMTLDPVQMLCYLRLDYAGFVAGQRYRLEAHHWLFQTESWLSDATGKRMADGQEWHCITQ
ncbi:hypothetical protein KRX52_06645 [Pseudomonas sp. MAP12]|uniref:Lipoprotein n=1 Tax=Geopseudomonas aromaticivorans TaxID=2849492 RepID=A0ABS6MUJ8_9GAMM|nr:hypothetical protein [Pseudomonas aromaticivorans]MBV2132481.1 hypothetical protein [Pseudomonas aromaticivorans]